MVLNATAIVSLISGHPINFSLEKLLVLLIPVGPVGGGGCKPCHGVFEGTVLQFVL
jgi:hypothetical protein